MRTHRMDEEIEINAQGAAQSKLVRRPRMVPAEALLRLSEVVGVGAEKYAENNWRKIPMEDHLNHALDHLYLLMDGDKSDDHLGHALCRLAFAVATERDFNFKEWRPLKGQELSTPSETPCREELESKIHKIKGTPDNWSPYDGGSFRCT